MDITREIAAKVLKIIDAGLSNGIGIAKPGKMCVEAAVCYALGEPHGDEPSCVAPALRSLKIRLNDAAWSSNQARAKGLRRLALVQLGSRGTLDEKKFVRCVVDNALRVSIPAALRAAASVYKSKRHTSKLIAAATRCENEGTRAAATAAAYAANAAANAAYDAANAAAYNAAYAAYDAANAAYDAANAAAYADDAAANAADAADAAYAAAYAANAAANAADAAAYAADAADAAAAAYAAAYADVNAAHAARDKSLREYAEAVIQILIEMNAPGCQWLDLAPVEAMS